MPKLRACNPAHIYKLVTQSRQPTTLVEQVKPGSMDWQADNGEVVAKTTPDYQSAHGGKDRSVQESGLWSERQVVEKSFCDTLNWDTTLTHFLQFYQQTEVCAANATPPDFIDASGAVLNTSQEKGSAPLQRFVQQSNQNNLNEGK